MIPQCQIKHDSIVEIMADEHISQSFKINAIIWNTFHDNVQLDEVEDFLKNYTSKTSTDYRRLLSVYDLKKYEK